jgi:hypothetical protein
MSQADRITEDNPPMVPPSSPRHISEVTPLVLSDARDSILLRERAESARALDSMRLSTLLRRVTARATVDNWSTAGGLVAQFHSTNGAFASCNLELTRDGRDRLVVGHDWEEAYLRAAELVARNPMLTEEEEHDHERE